MILSMSKQPEFGDGSDDPYELVQRLTNLPDDCAPEIAASSLKYLLSNDHRLRNSYLGAVQDMPSPSPGKQGLAIIVGNGAIETASQLLLLPGEGGEAGQFSVLPIIVCDRKRPALLGQKALRRTLLDLPTPAGYLSQIQALVDGGSPAAPVDIGVEYEFQKNAWNGASPEQPPKHFLTDQAAYNSAQQGARGPIGYWQVDLSNEKEVAAFGKAIRDVNGEALVANLSNAFTDSWMQRRLRQAVANLVRHVPFPPEAVIISAVSENSPLSEAQSITKWRRYTVRC